MKKFYSIVLVASMLLIGTRANAQLSFNAGFLNTQESTRYNDGDPVKTSMNGFFAGANYNIHLADGLGLAPGFYVSGLFYGNSDGGSIAGITASGKTSYSEFDINVPVNLNYRYSFGRDMSVFAFAGPILQYGIMSKTAVEGSLSGYGFSFDTGTKEIDNYDQENGTRNPFNVYAGGGVGFDFSGFQIVFGYDHSLTNLLKKDGMLSSRSQLKIGIGYIF